MVIEDIGDLFIERRADKQIHYNCRKIEIKRLANCEIEDIWDLFIERRFSFSLTLANREKNRVANCENRRYLGFVYREACR